MIPHLEALQRTIHTLRAPGGCPWDRRQSLRDAAHHLFDEAGELLDAAIGGDRRHVREELADLLFMICFCIEILGESEPASLDDVAQDGNEKLIRRHPHVFGDAEAQDTEESQARWNAIKDEEKRARGVDPDRESILEQLPASSSPLRQAEVYQIGAAGVGFDWERIDEVWTKLDEEVAELKEAAASGDRDAIEHEVGDLLFAAVNLARWLNTAPDVALRRSNQRFRRRFEHVEATFGNDRRRLQTADLERLEAAWRAAKAAAAAATPEAKERGGGRRRSG
jgi:MazG family protein